MKSLDYTVEWIARVMYWIAAIALVAMVVIVSLDVVLRDLFKHPLYFADQFSGYLLVLITFFGLPYVLSSDGFVRVDVVFGRLSERIKSLLLCLFYLLCFGYTAMFGYYSWVFVLQSLNLDSLSPDIVQIPLWIPQSSMSIGFTCLALCYFLKLIRQSYDLTVMFRGRAPSPNSGKVASVETSTMTGGEF